MAASSGTQLDELDSRDKRIWAREAEESPLRQIRWQETASEDSNTLRTLLCVCVSDL
jgi:hypothetical protein